MRTLFFTVVLLLVIAFGVATYRDWVDFSTKKSTQDGNKVTLSLELDPEKMHGDTEAVKQKAKELTETVKENLGAPARTESIKGQVVRVEMAAQRFVRANREKKELTIHVDPSSKIRLNGAEIQLEDIQAGDQVTVAFRVQDGKNIARSVTVERAA